MCLLEGSRCRASANMRVRACAGIGCTVSQLPCASESSRSMPKPALCVADTDQQHQYVGCELQRCQTPGLWKFRNTASLPDGWCYETSVSHKERPIFSKAGFSAGWPSRVCQTGITSLCTPYPLNRHSICLHLPEIPSSWCCACTNLYMLNRSQIGSAKLIFRQHLYAQIL